MQCDQAIELHYDDSAEWILQFIEKRLYEIDALKDEFVKSAERNVLYSFIDYRLKWLYTRHIESKYKGIIDDIIEICHKFKFTPLFQITGSEDICPETIEYSGDDGRLFFGNSGTNESYLYLFSSGQMRCLTTFSFEGYRIKEYNLSNNSDWLVMTVSRNEEYYRMFLWDVKQLKIIFISDDEKQPFTASVFDDGSLVYVNGKKIYLQNDEKIEIQTCNESIGSINILDQKHILTIGAHSTILNLSDYEEIQCDTDFSLDATSFLDKNGNLSVISNCMLYSLDLMGNTRVVRDLTQEISIPLEMMKKLKNNRIQPENIIFEGNTLSLSFPNQSHNIFREMHLQFDASNNFKFVGYCIKPYPMYMNVDKRDEIINDYLNIRPTLDEDPIDYLLEHGACFILKTDEKCIYQLRLISIKYKFVKILCRKINLEINCPCNYRDYVVNDDYIRSILGVLDPLIDDGIWSDVREKNLIGMKNNFITYCKKTAELSFDAVFSFVDDRFLQNVNWNSLDDGKEACLYSDIGDRLYIIGKNGCKSIKGYNLENRYDDILLISRENKTYCLDADGSLTAILLPVGIKMIIERKGKTILFEQNKQHKMLYEDHIYDLDFALFDYSKICIMDNCRFATYRDGKISIINASTGEVKEIDAFNCGKWTVLDAYKNLRYDLVSLEYNDDEVKMGLAELRPDGEFREKTDIELMVKSPYQEAYGPQYYERSFIAMKGADIILLNRDDGEIRLDHFKIGKDGIKNTNNSIKISTFRFYNKTFIPMNDPNKCIVQGMGFSEDESDRKHKGKNATEIRILNLNTGLRDRTLLYGVQGFYMPFKSKAILFSDDSYVAAECISQDGIMHVNLWDCRTGKRYPDGKDPVRGDLAYVDRGHVIIIDYEIQGYEREAFRVVYDLEMNEVSRIKMDAIPDFDGSYIYRGPLKINRIHGRIYDNTVFWRARSIKETKCDIYALPLNYNANTRAIPCEIEVELYYLKDGILSEPTIYRTNVGADYDSNDINIFKDEIVEDCLKIQSWNGSYLIKRLMKQSEDKVFLEMTYELVYLHEGTERTFVNVHNSFTSGCEGMACIGESGCSFIEEINDTLILRMVGEKIERKIELPVEFSDARILIADDRYAVLLSGFDEYFISDWESINLIENSENSPEKYSQVHFISKIDGKYIFKYGNEERVLSPSIPAWVNPNKTNSKVFTAINKGVYIHELD